jgi:inosose dehydratase
MLDRRIFLSACAIGTLSAAIPLVAAEPAKPSIGLGISLYGMRNLPIAEACRLCRQIGYDCVELPVMADWPADALTITDEQVTTIRDALHEHKLRLASLMENLRLVTDDATHADNLKRLQAATRLGRKLAPDQRPIIETVLGGKPAAWLEQKQQMAERLKDWAKVVEAEKGVLAIKAHVSGAAHLPEHVLELASTLSSTHPVSVTFDPSHFVLRGRKPVDCWQQMASATSFVHIKDAAGTAEKPKFLLPGDGDIDLVALLRAMASSGYDGDMVVEVSAQLSSQLNYNAEAAARTAYHALSRAFEKAGIARR